MGRKETESVNEYFARTLAIMGKMKAHGDTKIDEETVVEKVLLSLGPKYNYVVCAINRRTTFQPYPLMSYRVAFWFMNIF